jgi:hypothetical protein
MSGPHSDQIKYDGVLVQSSMLGISIPMFWGTTKLSCNMVDYLDFQQHKQNTGGKGGAPTTYTYSATLVLVIGQDGSGGPIAGVRTIWRDSTYYVETPAGSKIVNGETVTYSSKTALQNSSLSVLMDGAIGQAPWDYLTTAHPTHAVGYSGFIYAGGENFPLNTSATPPNFNFECQSSVRSIIDGVQSDDALPDAILSTFLPRVQRFRRSRPRAARPRTCSPRSCRRPIRTVSAPTAWCSSRPTAIRRSPPTG